MGLGFGIQLHAEVIETLGQAFAPGAALYDSTNRQGKHVPKTVTTCKFGSMQGFGSRRSGFQDAGLPASSSSSSSSSSAVASHDVVAQLKYLVLSVSSSSNL